jgi:hypothetical protein
MKGKKLFSFWLVWPRDKSCEEGNEDSEDELDPHASNANGRDRDNVRDRDRDSYRDPRDGVRDRDRDRDNEVHTVHSAAKGEEKDNRPKDFKSIVHTEAMSAELQRRKAEDQLQRHHSQDASLNLGIRVAAVTVGGVVVGALTAGIGLLPYLAVVGLAAAASGGAVALQYRRPSDSRLILASEDLEYVLMWRTAIEDEIVKVEMQGKPLLPAGADLNVISHILGISGAGGLGGWTRVGIIEGMRIMELVEAVDGYTYRRAQLVVKCSPTNVFVVIMDIAQLQWPQRGYSKVAHHVDDHVDILEVSFMQRRPRKDPLTGAHRTAGGFLSALWPSTTSSDLKDHGGTGNCLFENNCPLLEEEYVRVSGFLSRFWRLDDDGSYIVILTTTHAPVADPLATGAKVSLLLILFLLLVVVMHARGFLLFIL